MEQASPIQKIVHSAKITGSWLRTTLWILISLCVLVGTAGNYVIILAFQSEQPLPLGSLVMIAFMSIAVNVVLLYMTVRSARRAYQLSKNDSFPKL